MRQSIKQLYASYQDLKEQEVSFFAWVRTNRNQKEFGFMQLNDGTCFETLQVVYDRSVIKNFNDISKVRCGASVFVKGTVFLTPNMNQPFEIHATECHLEGDSLENYPIQPKRHTREFLREQAHLRPRTNLFNAVFRVRSVAAYAIHKFFQDKNFVYVNTPIITASDAEGAGEMFQVTSLDLNNIPRLESGEIDFKKDFFAKKASLTVSGQLEAEAYALSFRDVYTFGPTFRAENSNTQKHASEFWMIEPEIAFADLNDDMELIEEMIKYVVSYVMRSCPSEMNFFDQHVEKGLKARLENVCNNKFNRVTHEEAITILKEAKVKFENTPDYGCDLATEHEKYLTEKHFQAPVFVTDWPKDIKAFYMRLNDDGKTVAAVDLLVPGSGELVGGSQREERIEYLLKRMEEVGIEESAMDWYLDTRRYGGCKHAGFGLGFERLVMYLTGVENIRDVIPFPRTPKNCEF